MPSIVTLDYLKSGNRFLDRNNLIEGVVYGFSRDSRLDPKYVSVVIGDRELKWDLHEVFKKCGLRREAVPAGVQQQVSWTYFTSTNCLPILYGYRGILVEKDLATGNFIVGAEEDGLFPQEADWNPEDFHRHYVPFRRTDGVVEERSRGGNKDDCQTDDTDSVKNRQRFIRNSNPMVSYYHPLRKEFLCNEKHGFDRRKLSQVPPETKCALARCGSGSKHTIQPSGYTAGEWHHLLRELFKRQ